MSIVKVTIRTGATNFTVWEGRAALVGCTGDDGTPNFSSRGNGRDLIDLALLCATYVQRVIGPVVDVRGIILSNWDEALASWNETDNVDIRRFDGPEPR